MSDATYLGPHRAGHHPARESGSYLGERSYRVLGEAVPGLLWVADRAGRLTFVNRRWQEYTGSSVEDFAAVGWEFYVHPEDVRSWQDQWKSAGERREPFEAEVR